MRQVFIYFGILLLSQNAFSQVEGDSWDVNYPERNFRELLKYEKAYADSVDRGLIEGRYYVRMDKYKFPARYTGLKREIPDSIKASIKRVYTLQGNKEYMPVIEKIRYQYQFNIDGVLYWFAMQAVLDKPFKKEIRKDEGVYLYCLFLNEYKENGELFNSFLISEFRQ